MNTIIHHQLFFFIFDFVFETDILIYSSLMHLKLMSLEYSLLILGAIIFLYGFLSVLFQRKGIFEKYNISFYGPALLLRTKKGVGFLKKLAEKKRFWKAFGSFGIFFCFLMMIVMVALLAFNMWTVGGMTTEEQAALPGIEFGLVIPGLNPLLPLEYIFYVIIALIIAVIVHEFSHGILTFAQGLKVKSLGVLYLIIPLGAFCEPDEEEVKVAEPKKRMRLYAAGPMSNFTVAFITIFLFSSVFMASVQPIEGVHILYTIEESPAESIGLDQGMVITSLNNTEIESWSDFISVMDNTSVDQTIPISYKSEQREFNTEVTLASRADFSNNESDRNDSFMGLGPNLYVNNFVKVLQTPLRYEFPNGMILLYSLPFFSYLVGYNPIVAPFTQSYVINGPLSYIPSQVFWPFVNLLYWVFWLNLVVAFFNVLPMIPLDGGFLFSDGLRSLINNQMSEERKEKIVKNVSLFISLLILGIVLFPWLVKYF